MFNLYFLKQKQLVKSILADVNIPFIENKGQLYNDVRYYADIFIGRVLVTDNVT